MPEFTEPENWPPNSLDLNPVDYSVWLQQMVYHHKISDTDQLKRVLIDCWAQLNHAGHVKSNNRSAAKRLMIVIKVKGDHVQFRPN